MLQKNIDKLRNLTFILVFKVKYLVYFNENLKFQKNVINNK